MLKHTIAAALVMGTLALVSVPVEGRENVTWRYLEQDNVSAYQAPHRLAVTGWVRWWYASNNSNHRYVGISLTAYQTQGAPRPMCVGVRVTYSVTNTSTSRGGSGGGGISLTGPSANLSQTWNTTTSTGVTSDGFEWSCPRPIGGGGMAYVDKTVNGGRPIHPAVDGVVYGAAIDTCVADQRQLSQRWCLPTEFNRFGAR